MIQNCGEILKINYKEACCLKHLIEMSEQAEMQLLTNKYAKLLLRTLYRLSQKGQLPLENLNLDIASPFLDILSKYISHFFFLNKYSYAKILSKIAIQVSEATIYREHPNVIFRLCAIRNNMACIYEKEGKYQRSLTELSFCKKYLCYNKDKVIFYNNFISIQLKTGNMKDINDSFTQLRKGLIEEVDLIKAEKLYKGTAIDADIKLVSFLMFNLGYSLEHLQRIKEAKETFKMGFEFTICMLGENNYYSEKYCEKIEKYALNKVETNSALIESEDELFLEEMKRKKQEKAQNVELNAKLAMILTQLELIGNKFEKNELTENDQQEIYKEAMKIKEMISSNTVNSKVDKPSKSQVRKVDSANSKQTNTSTNKKHKEIEPKQDNANDKAVDNSMESHGNTINLNEKLNQINLLDLDLLSDYQTDREFKSFQQNSTIPIEPQAIAVPQVQVPKISVDGIGTDDRYECETFYQKKDTNESLKQKEHFDIKIDLDSDLNNVYQCVTYYMQHLPSSTEKPKPKPNDAQLIEDEIKVSSLMAKMQPIAFNIDDYFDELIKPKETKSPKKFKVFRFIDNSLVILCLQPQANSLDISIDSEVKHTSFNYDKLKTFLNQLLIKHSIPYLTLLSELKTIEDFTHKVLSNYITCRKQDDYKFGISKHPIGIFTKKTINFTIRFTKCTFDLLIFNKKAVKLLIYSSANEDQSIEIDSLFDEETFNDLFKLNSPILPENSSANLYSMKLDDYTQDEVLMKLGKSIQRLVNAFCLKRYNTFEDLAKDKNLRLRCLIKAHCDDIELTISDFNEKLFKVMRLSAMSSVQSEGIIYSCDLKTVFGYETKDLFGMTDYYEKTFISQLILSSIQLNMTTSKLELVKWSIVSHYAFTLSKPIPYRINNH